jgi:UDP-GlcNAc:undecaprenyl-phosphate GlcNAc-1-phosphate transferase
LGCIASASIYGAWSLLVFIISLFTCSVSVVVLHRFAHRFGIVDKPGGRKQHAHPTPTVGGVAMFGAVLLALFLGDGLKTEITLLLQCAAGLLVLGVLDDKKIGVVTLKIKASISDVAAVQTCPYGGLLRGY